MCSTKRSSHGASTPFAVRAEVVAVASRSKARAQAFIKETKLEGKAQAYESYQVCVFFRGGEEYTWDLEEAH